MPITFGGNKDNENRFIVAHTDKAGFASQTKVLIDRYTGVNYIFHIDGYAGGLCPLLGADGKPVVTPVE